MLALVVTLSVTWVNEITTGELIAVGVTVLFILSSIIGFYLTKTAPNRAYKMTLFDRSIDKLISDDNKVTEYKSWKG